MSNWPVHQADVLGWSPRCWKISRYARLNQGDEVEEIRIEQGVLQIQQTRKDSHQETTGLLLSLASRIP